MQWVKSAFNTICIFTQPTRQSETDFFPPSLELFSLALMHETFIKLLFIAIDVFNGEIRNRFMIFPIQYFTIVGMLFYISISLMLACHTRECFPEKQTGEKLCRISNIYMYAISLNEISGINLKFKRFGSWIFENVEFLRDEIWRRSNIHNWQTVEKVSGGFARGVLRVFYWEKCWDLNKCITFWFDLFRVDLGK